MAKRAITKERVTFSLDIELVQQFNKFIKSIGMSKSAFIEFILKEQMNTTNQLFNSSDTLSEALVFLSKQMQDIKDLMSDDNYKKYLEKLSEVQNGGAVQTDTHEVRKHQ